MLVNYERSFLFEIRRQSERNKLAREKQLREAAEREKNALEQQMMHYQEESRMAGEQLVTRMHIDNWFKFGMFYLAVAVLQQQFNQLSEKQSLNSKEEQEMRENP